MEEPIQVGVAVARPATDDGEAWRAYWTALGQPWRRAPEITADRQRALAERRALPVDPQQQIFPFRLVALNRADLEWLLATRGESQRPAASGGQAEQRTAPDVSAATLQGADLSGLPLEGLIAIYTDFTGANLAGAHLEGAVLVNAQLARADLRDAHLEGADLRYVDFSGAQLDGAHLAGITLAGGGYDYLSGAALRLFDLKGRPLALASFKRADLSGMHLEGTNLANARFLDANLAGTHLEGANLAGAYFTGANLTGAHLEGADLLRADFEGADLTGAALDGTLLRSVSLKNAVCTDASFRGATLDSPVLTGARFDGAHFAGAKVEWNAAGTFDLQGVDLAGAHVAGLVLDGLRLEGQDLHGRALAGISLAGAHLERTNLAGAYLEGTILRQAHLDAAPLTAAHLEGADLREAHLEEANLDGSHLEGADLRHAVFDPLTSVAGAAFGGGTHGYAAVGGLFWSSVDLTTVNWAPVARLGDERLARKSTSGDRAARSAAYQDAIRAYRQLAIRLDKQSLTQPAERFSYHALVLRRHLLWWQVTRERQLRKLGPYLLSALLAVLSGYGYRMWRILIVYACVIASAAGAYAILGAATHAPLAWYQALFASVSAFHGRVFSSQFQPGSPQLWVSALEAVAGLLIESVFIAMLTRRFFAR